MLGSKSALLTSVLEDVEKYKNKRQIVRASLVERLLVRKVPVSKLHPNPDDEFSMAHIGPSDSIVQKYSLEARYLVEHDEAVFPEPIIVQKMQEDGYMILNGHHRWAGAVRAMIPKVRVVIVNPKNSNLH